MGHCRCPQLLPLINKLAAGTLVEILPGVLSTSSLITLPPSRVWLFGSRKRFSFTLATVANGSRAILIALAARYRRDEVGSVLLIA